MSDVLTCHPERSMPTADGVEGSQKHMTSPREELLKIQRRLWKRNHNIIEHSIFVKEPGFSKYEKKYLDTVANYERVATNDEMLSAVKKARLIYVGDYHTCNQSQRSFLRILKAVIAECPNILLGFELINKRHQLLLDKFIKDEISEEAFVRKIGLRRHWVFDLWPNFKPLFEFAKYHKLPTLAIDAAPSAASLKERDTATAKLIAQILKKYPEHKIFILIGDLHLAHLPDLVSKFHGSKVSDLILFQNSDSIYWKLANAELEDRTEVVKINDRAFCRMHTPPIVCQQSYLNWLEHEEGEIDYSDAKASFLELVSHITDFLGIDLGASRELVDVYTCGDLSFFQRLEESGKFDAKELKALKRQIMASESYYIQEKHVVYLANLSINHAAEEAAHFIKHVCSGTERPRAPEDAFYANILHEALAFFGSKLVNHKRKCFHKKEFESLIAYFETVAVPQGRRVEFETAVLVIEFLKRRGKKIEHGRWMRRRDLFFSVTHAIGYILGDHIFYGMMGERLTKEDVKALFYDPWKREGEAELTYRHLSEQLKSVKIPRRM